jgi:Uma2 family endonuclease
VRVRSAVATADSQPEPDLAVARGQARDYLDRHPGPADVPLVIEVADSSLARDRGLKARVYARAGIPNYWIVNLVDRHVEVYSEPTDQATYARIETIGPDGAIRLVIDDAEVGPIAARDLLP